jgi:predicted lactoylglutathione lyase
MTGKKEKAAAKGRESTRQFIGIGGIKDYCLKTAHGELVYFHIKPTNLSTLSESSVSARIYALMTVLKGMAEIEMLCLNSRENFEDNKRSLRERIGREDNPAVRKLLEQDLLHLDRIQVQMATAREFLIVIRLQKEEKESELLAYLSRIEKSLKDQGFTVKRADEADIKRLLAVYFEQNVTTERFEDFDGERWVILND